MLTHILTGAGGYILGTAVTAWWAHAKLHTRIDALKNDLVAEFNKIVARVKGA